MGNRLRTIARRILHRLHGTVLAWPLLVSRLFPPPGAREARRLERAGHTDDAVAAWQAIQDRRIGAAEIVRLRLKRATGTSRRGDWSSAVADYEAAMAIAPQNGRVRDRLEYAALRGARKAQADGHWLDACRMWLAFGRVSADKVKCQRNLLQCARYAGESADTAEKIERALTAWRYVGEFDPNSKDAQRGMVWCHMTLAREAERAGNLAAARAQWEAVVALAPDDMRGREGLRRIASSPQQQAAQ